MAMHSMHWGVVVEDAARLEAALDRIARTALMKPAAKPDAASGPTPETEQAIQRLDALIADIRAALGKDAAD